MSDFMVKQDAEDRTSEEEEEEEEEDLSSKSSTLQPLTLFEFLVYKQKRSFPANGEFYQLINHIQAAVKTIAYTVRHASSKITCNEKKRKDEEELSLNQKVENIIMSILSTSGTAKVLVSKLTALPILVDEEFQGSHVVVFDPLCGFKPEDPSLPSGTIFGIFRPRSGQSPQQDFVRPGSQLTAAGYALYGAATHLVLTLGVNQGVQEFVLDPEAGEFLLCEPSVRLPARGTVYSINEGLSPLWDPAISDYITTKKDPMFGCAYEYEYTGSFVADVHTVLKMGGIFILPEVTTTPSSKLTLIFECGPMGLVCREAGGLAVTGELHVLDTVPEQALDDTALYLGCTDDVRDLLELVTLLKASKDSDVPAGSAPDQPAGVIL